MADGGASSFIMLITALLVSGGASSLLINEWSDAVQVTTKADRKAMISGEISVTFAGDPAMVSYDDNPTLPAFESMTFYLLNDGLHELSTTNYQLLIDGIEPSGVSFAFVASATSWGPGDMVEVTADDTSFGYSNGDDVRIFFTGSSVKVGGFIHSVTTDEEVRLHVV
ncbi:hypothetical protein N9M83_00690 [Candidatus Poseidonia alphae]|uniref:hypothetical protein n=1 Tax=Candidatus Poseidonia alphae TaxID=1915863 RepID=UPI000110CC6C|nr:hypothetical protein [Candidatus Poseidonia alphae]MDA8530047.1 hypothetical protein [Candidatus Poseidonia alphae]MDA8758735.1 hypothetical protein [Candidatus Poseidonia alphae]MDB2335960.1 hypothetical protein [Candidatus Poseidonia alphae]MDB2569440.1 hypothetical protein [Candidatus Poseidonia alphae]